MPEQDSKPSWADQMEEGEGYTVPISTPVSASFSDVTLPPHSEEFDGDTKIITEYKVNKDGKKIKLVLYYNVERRLVSKSIAKRKTWKKFGLASTDPPGPNHANTIVSEEIFMQFFTTKEEEQNRAGEDDVLNKLKGQKIVKCRICKDEHWTTQCPYKDRLGALPELVKEEAKPATPGGAAAQSDDKLKAGKYVPPSMRDGANRRGDAMPNSKNQELPTIRVTNLSEEVRDSDLQELFRPFGSISRVYLGKDKLTGQSKGFAFISFIRREDAARAILGVNGYGYDNLILSVEWAKPSGSTM